jgi:hypothetical protein
MGEIINTEFQKNLNRRDQFGNPESIQIVILKYLMQNKDFVSTSFIWSEWPPFWIGHRTVSFHRSVQNGSILKLYFRHIIHPADPLISPLGITRTSLTADKIKTYANPLYPLSPTFLLGHGQRGEAYSGHRFNLKVKSR